MNYLHHGQAGDGSDSNYDLYMNNLFQKYWHNHTRIREWLTEVDRDCESYDFAKQWQATPNHLYQAARYMEWWCSRALYMNESRSLFPHCMSQSFQQENSFCNSSSSGQKRYKRARKSRRSSRRKHRCLNHDSVPVDDYSQCDGNESDGVVFEFEMSDELLEFFKQTAEHRKERALVKASQTSNKTDGDRLLDLEIAHSGRGRATVLPPSEQKGMLRGTEMLQLYGSGAAMIQGMETAMQLNFDRNTDRHKPRPWPALPLNIQFDRVKVVVNEVTN